MADIDKIKEGLLKPDEKLQSFDKHGITEDYLIGKLKAELEAEEEIQRRISKKEVKVVKIPIWKIRQDARKDAHKLRGDYPAEKHEHTGDVIFHSNVPEPDMPEEEEKTPTPPEPEDVELFDVTEIPEGGTGTTTNFSPDTTGTVDEIPIKDEIEPPYWVKKEQPTPDHDQDKEFKDHHRSRRERGK